ncbi:hypothetical protein FACS189426_06460 [Bacteroidia bacterium]|nr:hypothetical protein FACS189426_06460 [Bacteroidia bacterium]GHV72048.1 hypothetical protein FACS189420_8680 [Bacteroidia bacterium]
MKGILFKEPLFHKVIDGKKTQTRQIMKPQPSFKYNGKSEIVVCELSENCCYNSDLDKIISPRFKVGEKVFLKEPYSFGFEDECVYKFSSEKIANFEWENKLFMPEKYARYFIEITGVRCERLQDISYEHCLKEGIVRSWNNDEWYNLINRPYEYFNGYVTCEHAEDAYADLIDRINGKGTWKRNPFVWVYDFKLLK